MGFRGVRKVKGQRHTCVRHARSGLMMVEGLSLRGLGSGTVPKHDVPTSTSR